MIRRRRKGVSSVDETLNENKFKSMIHIRRMFFAPEICSSSELLRAEKWISKEKYFRGIDPSERAHGPLRPPIASCNRNSQKNKFLMWCPTSYVTISRCTHLDRTNGHNPQNKVNIAWKMRQSKIFSTTSHKNGTMANYRWIFASRIKWANRRALVHATWRGSAWTIQQWREKRWDKYA
jgi:hypothetical protein